MAAVIITYITTLIPFSVYGCDTTRAGKFTLRKYVQSSRLLYLVSKIECGKGIHWLFVALYQNHSLRIVYQFETVALTF
jgi:hypothetical protein